MINLKKSNLKQRAPCINNIRSYDIWWRGVILAGKMWPYEWYLLWYIRRVTNIRAIYLSQGDHGFPPLPELKHIHN